MNIIDDFLQLNTINIFNFLLKSRNLCFSLSSYSPGIEQHTADANLDVAANTQANESHALTNFSDCKPNVDAPNESSFKHPATQTNASLLKNVAKSEEPIQQQIECTPSNVSSVEAKLTDCSVIKLSSDRSHEMGTHEIPNEDAKFDDEAMFERSICFPSESPDGQFDDSKTNDNENGEQINLVNADKGPYFKYNKTSIYFAFRSF